MNYEGWARLYDALVRRSDDVGFFVDLSVRATGKVVELMAGTGRVSLPVAAAGVDLTCVDSSPAMLGVLRDKLEERDLEAAVVEQSITCLDLADEYALAFIAFNSFEELVADSDRTSALHAIREHLAPGGTAVITLHDPETLLRDTGPTRTFRHLFEDPLTGRRVAHRPAN